MQPSWTPRVENSAGAICSAGAAHKMFKAAHLVPKSLQESSTSFLFGGGAKPATDVRNGTFDPDELTYVKDRALTSIALLLCGSLQKMLGSGGIAIVPAARTNDEWKCIVTRKESLDDLIVQYDNVKVRVKEVHEKKLQFRSENRPAKRYLFFRYLMTYRLNKAKGNVEWAQAVGANIAGWLTPGKYLRNSTLRVLAKQFTGEDLPEEMLEATDKLTFYDDEELLLPQALEKATRSLREVLKLRATTLASRTSDADDGDEEEGEDECDGGTN